MRGQNDLFRLYITVDEKGNLGQTRRGERYYIVVGSVIVDREAFEDISRYYSVLRGREVKYYDDPDLHEPIIRRASPFVEDVYFVRYHKDPLVHNTLDGLPKDRKVAQHLAMLQALADAMLRDMDWGPVDVDIDYNRLVSSEPVPKTFECSPSRDGRDVVCRVQKSHENYGLMTNDFIVGAVGDTIRDPGDKDAQKLIRHLKKKPREIYLRNKKRRMIR